MDSRDKFAQMLREGYETLDPEKEQREYIRELLCQKEQRRKRRIKTITAVAAAFLIVVGAVLAVGGCFGAVEADKNDRTKVEEQDGSVVISDENAEGQEVMPETAMTTDWNKVDKLKEKYPEMITFTDVPEGMEFVSVEVIVNKDVSFEAVYSYLKNDSEIFVCQRICEYSEQKTQIVEKSGEILNYKGNEVVVNDKNGNRNATLATRDETINIIGKLSNKEITKVLDKMKSF